VSTTEELLGRKISGSGLESREYDLGIRHADHVAPSIRSLRAWRFEGLIPLHRNLDTLGLYSSRIIFRAQNMRSQW
jgi:hypothetical protein